MSNINELNNIEGIKPLSYKIIKNTNNDVNFDSHITSGSGGTC